MNAKQKRLTSEHLLASLSKLPVPNMYWVGFSGGADSTALLQALHECRDELPAPIPAAAGALCSVL